MRKHGLAYLAELAGLGLFLWLFFALGQPLYVLCGVLCLVMLALEGVA